MFDLRTRLAALHKRLGTAGFMLAIVALVLALTGAAIAAGGLTKSQEKRVIAIAKKFAGKNGAPGAEGKQGPAGPAGANGKDGEKGEAGSAGANGKSVVIGNSASCTAGGKTIEVEGSGKKENICNGNPAEYPKVLPSGEIESGSWANSISGTKYFGVLGYVGFSPITFPIPLGFNAPLTTHYIGFGHYSKKQTECEAKSGSEKEACENELKEEKEACPDNSEPGKGAAAGNLCIYAAAEFGSVEVLTIFPDFENGEGATLFMQNTSAPEGYALGVWAVRAE